MLFHFSMSGCKRLSMLPDDTRLRSGVFWIMAVWLAVGKLCCLLFVAHSFMSKEVKNSDLLHEISVFWVFFL